MNTIQSFRMALQTLASKKLRSFLTMLGTIIGVAAVIALVSVTQAQNEATRDLWTKMSENMVYVNAYPWNMDMSEVEEQLSDFIKYDISDLTVGVTPSQSDWIERISWGEREMQYMTLQYGSEQFSECNQYVVKEGRDFCFIDIERNLNVCLIGSYTREMLFGYEEAIGQTLEFKGQRFTVVGVYEARDDGYGDDYPMEYSSNNVIVVPYTQIKYINSWSQNITNYIVKCHDVRSTIETTELLETMLDDMIGEDEYGYKSYSVYNNLQNLTEMEAQESSQMTLLIVIAAISLLVGGIGIMNIMLVTVTERTREIGIRKAIGAPRRTIISQFLIEASVLSGCGGFIGLFLGFAATLYWGKIQYNIIATPDLVITVVSFTASVLMGIVFGWYPASKASRLQPVDALRNE